MRLILSSDYHVPLKIHCISTLQQNNPLRYLQLPRFKDDRAKGTFPVPPLGGGRAKL